jgi:phosphoribosylglycinamide formyltransferase-1
MYKIGWFSTGRGAGSRALLKTIHRSIARGEIRADLAFVFCNRERGQTPETDSFLDLVESFGIPLVCLSSGKFKGRMGAASIEECRLDYDREIMKRLEGFDPDLCVLAGYMLVVGEEMCRRYNMVNLHPALPGGPAGTWREVIWQLMEERARETGAMMHLVTPELDKGPPVTYCRFPISGGPFDQYWEQIEGLSVDRVKSQQGESNPLFRLIREEGVKREQPLIAATIRAFSEGRVRIRGGKPVDAEGNQIGACSLTDEIEEILRHTRAG